MDYLFTHHSALEYLRAANPPLVSVRNAHAAVPPHVPGKRALAALPLTELGIVEHPYHCAAAKATGRREDEELFSHLVSTELPSGSFVQAGEGVLASSPGLCFVQMAQSLPLPQVIALGCEFCGSYALAPGTERGFRDRPPLTTIRALRAYLGRVRLLHGIAPARRAAHYVLEGAASPMETVLALLLCLPVMLGGYGLPQPHLNFRVELSPGTFALCDLCWPEARFALEYDSDRYHASVHRLARDSTRRAALARVGMKVLSVTRSQVRDAVAFDKVAHVTSRMLNVRVRIPRARFADRFRLRAALLPVYSE